MLNKLGLYHISSKLPSISIVAKKVLCESSSDDEVARYLIDNYNKFKDRKGVVRSTVPYSWTEKYFGEVRLRYEYPPFGGSFTYLYVNNKERTTGDISRLCGIVYSGVDGNQLI